MEIVFYEEESEDWEEKKFRDVWDVEGSEET